jgi:hypothetical protein
MDLLRFVGHDKLVLSTLDDAAAFDAAFSENNAWASARARVGWRPNG